MGGHSLKARKEPGRRFLPTCLSCLAGLSCVGSERHASVIPEMLGKVIGFLHYVGLIHMVEQWTIHIYV